MFKTFYVIPSTKVYDVRCGVSTVEELLKDKSNNGHFITYDLWGNEYGVELEDAGVMRIKASNYGIYFGESTEVPQFGHRPARKWKLLNGSEDDRRNALAECLELQNGKPVLITETPEEMESFMEYLPFYGVTTDVSTVEGTIEIDKKRPPCFFNKCMGQQVNQLPDIVAEWSDGGWFRTLSPINKEYVDNIDEKGVFYEGYCGWPALLPVAIIKGKGKEFPVVKLTCSVDAGVDFGKVYM